LSCLKVCDGLLNQVCGQARKRSMCPRSTRQQAEFFMV
jgi:hypothetical protein